MLRNQEKNIIAVSKVKTKLIHIPNYKLSRIIDEPTGSTSLKDLEIPVFQHLIMKNDIVFQFFQQKQKNGTFPSKSSISSNCNNPVTYFDGIT